MKKFLNSSVERIKYHAFEAQNVWNFGRLTRQVSKIAQPKKGQKPVIFFNASTRIISTSLNAAFSALTAWGLRIAGVPVKHFVCNAGMSRCVLETRFTEPSYEPACHLCTAQSRRIYSGADTDYFSYQEEKQLVNLLTPLSIDELSKVVYQEIPLGKLVVPSFRWALRRQFLPEDEDTRFLLRQFILSAFNVAKNFNRLLDNNDPAVVVVFNGQMYPEATAKYLAQERNIPVVTHEVSFQPFAGFFSYGQATAFPIEIPKDFELNDEQNTTLDRYLENRFQGKFSMAGIQFWPEMKGLDKKILDKVDQFKQMVPIFTNVIFDTSQPHANTVFEHMFSWLDAILEKIKTHPETLFVIRAHPDEQRIGKESVDSVRKWVAENNLEALSNIIFIDSNDYVSSYELIRRSKFVIVYNSTIGLEATLLGAAVLSGGKSRFTDYETMFFPQSVKDYLEMFEDFLSLDQIEIPKAFYQNARRILYYQNWHTPLPFGEFLEEHALKGYVRLKNFDPMKLHPEKSETMKRIQKGLFENGNFDIEDKT